MRGIVFLAIVATAIGGCTQTEKSDTTPPAATASAPAPAAVPTGDNVVTVKVGSDFQPAVINAKAGQPLTLRFDRTAAAPSCGDEVIFKALNQTHKVPDKQITEVKLTPQQTGDLHFTCGMNMMKGKIVVQ